MSRTPRSGTTWPDAAPEIAAEAGRGLQQGFVPQTHEPGAEAEVDFADLWVILRGEKTKTFLFTLRLSYSGKSVHGRSSPKRRRRSWKVMSRRSPRAGRDSDREDPLRQLEGRGVAGAVRAGPGGIGPLYGVQVPLPVD